MANAAMYRSATQGAQNLKQAADMIPEKNVWTALAKAGIKAMSAYFTGQTERRQLEHEGSNYRFQMQSHFINANMSKLNQELNLVQQNVAQSDIRLATNEVFNQYIMGGYQAMEQGLRDAQIIHDERARTASSGVRMNSASKQAVEDSNRLGAQINQWIIQQNTWSNARAAQQNVRNAENNLMALKSQYADLKMEEANSMAQAFIAWGDAEASSIMAKSIKPLINAGVAFAQSMAQSASNGGFGGGSFGGVK